MDLQCSCAVQATSAEYSAERQPGKTIQDIFSLPPLEFRQHGQSAYDPLFPPVFGHDDQYPPRKQGLV